MRSCLLTFLFIWKLSRKKLPHVAADHVELQQTSAKIQRFSPPDHAPSQSGQRKATRCDSRLTTRLVTNLALTKFRAIGSEGRVVKIEECIPILSNSRKLICEMWNVSKSIKILTCCLSLRLSCWSWTPFAILCVKVEWKSVKLPLKA